MAGRTPFFRPRLAFEAPATAPLVSAAAAHRPNPAVSAAPPRDAAAAYDPPPLTPHQADQFRTIMLPHLDAAYGLARFLARDATAAEDIVQNAFLRAFRAFPAYQGGAPKAWLFAIVRRCFLDWAAANRNLGELMVDDDGAGGIDIADPDMESPETALARRQDVQIVRSVIENLPEPFRETLVLRELETLSYKQIAELTGAPIGTVMSRLARARRMLADLLGPALGLETAR